MYRITIEETKHSKQKETIKRKEPEFADNAAANSGDCWFFYGIKHLFAGEWRREIFCD